MQLSNTKSLGVCEVFIADQPSIRASLLANIADLVGKSMGSGIYPGAVILAAHQGQTIYRGVFGYQSLAPESLPMRFETIFDLASLTKVVVTTTAVMQLVEAGKLDLSARVADYWPAFASDKQAVTIRQLLTHTSGLPAQLPSWELPEDPRQQYAAGIHQAAQVKLLCEPGTAFIYGDINFIVLGYLVELISGKPLDHYARTHIFKPLQMTSTTFLPPPEWQNQIAPTSSPADQQLRWGRVNDPATEKMGGVSGVAGLFGDAHDLGVFLQCILNNGRIDEFHYLLGPAAVLAMSTPQTPPGIADIRGFGWDIDSRYSNRGALMSTRSFGHSGWTGTSIWVDPLTQTYVVILASRTYPSPTEKKQLLIDRRAIANIVAGSLTGIKI